MKKCEKGTPGYLEYKKKAEIFRAILYFAIVAAIFLLGYSQTHTKKNLLTVVAVVGCLPACKVLVGVITRLPHSSIDKKLAEEIQSKSTHITGIYDLIVTSSEKVMPIDCIVVSGNTVFGYTSSEKVDLKYASNYLKTMLRQNHFTEVSVKLMNQYKPFLARVEGLDNIAAVEKADTKAHEEKICRLIENLSL